MNYDFGRRKAPRKLISVPGKIRAGRGISYCVAITDLSEGGCCALIQRPEFCSGSAVTIRVGRLDPIEATVRWVKHGEMGLEFQRPIYGPVFEHIRMILDGSNEMPERRKKMRC